MNDTKLHSEDYFGEQRDFWWNADFLELMARRLNFSSIHSVLDVGCGQGHWGQLLANSVIRSSVNDELTIEEEASLYRFQLYCEKGKEALGLGFNSLGDLLPGMLSEFGLTHQKVFQSDKASFFIPPYESLEQKINIKQKKDWDQKDFFWWEREETKRYFLAGKGNEEEFTSLFELALKRSKKEIQAIDENCFHTAGGGVHYLISGRKSFF